MDQTTPAEKLDQEIVTGAIESADRSNEYILEMKGISKAFPGVQALDAVDFELRPGSFTRFWVRTEPENRP